MGIKKFDKTEQIKQVEAPKAPDYRNKVGECAVSVWETRKDEVYGLSAKFQREYVDGKGRKQFSDSFELEHMDDLKKLISIVEKDMKASFAEESGNNPISGIDKDIFDKL